MNSVTSEFNKSIVNDVGEVEISNTQKIRVLVLEGEGTPEISIQKWWRPDIDIDWQVGKGFKLSPVEASYLGNIIEKAGNLFVNVR